MEKMSGGDDGCFASGGVKELHVLAVDDSLVDRKVIERLLKISACKVTAVESGTRALQYLGLEGEKGSAEIDGVKVNLIMTDYSMPGMTGYELLKKIKGCSALREIPVLIMSSENVLARIHRCLEEGAEEFLMKPVKLSDVKRLKDSLLGESEEKVPPQIADESLASSLPQSRKRKFADESPVRLETSSRCSSAALPVSFPRLHQDAD